MTPHCDSMEGRSSAPHATPWRQTMSVLCCHFLRSATRQICGRRSRWSFRCVPWASYKDRSVADSRSYVEAMLGFEVYSDSVPKALQAQYGHGHELRTSGSRKAKGWQRLTSAEEGEQRASREAPSES